MIPRCLALLTVPAAVIAFAAPASATPTLTQAGPVVTTAPVTQGIIMRDGGVCDPIRHMGC